MPNHITNKIRLFGDESDIRRLMDAVKDEKYGTGTIDFDKINPMPDNIYRGPLGVAEEKLYGENNWYDWSIRYRGTKWGAYGFDDSIDYSANKDTITFLTAWSAPHPVIEKLAQMYPAVKIEHEWADEDIGSNCGRRVYYDGECVEEYYPDYGKTSLEFAAAVMDRQLEEDYGLYLNASGTGYIRIEGDDEFELIELFDQPALFTNDRITDANVPKGMYCYHIRHDDEGKFSTVEKSVFVNHAGSVVTKEPLYFSEKGFITFTDDTLPDFKGETMSLYQFKEYSPEQTIGENEEIDMEMKL